jgi:hypothetical protein
VFVIDTNEDKFALAKQWAGEGGMEVVPVNPKKQDKPIQQVHIVATENSIT